MPNLWYNTRTKDDLIDSKAGESLVVFIEKNFGGTLTGIKHGTVAVKKDGEQYEVTTFRADSEYADGRHPNTVKLLNTIEEDLARRDFTINAMAYNESKGFGAWASGRFHRSFYLTFYVDN